MVEKMLLCAVVWTWVIRLKIFFKVIPSHCCALRGSKSASYGPLIHIVGKNGHVVLENKQRLVIANGRHTDTGEMTMHRRISWWVSAGLHTAS